MGETPLDLARSTGAASEARQREGAEDDPTRLKAIVRQTRD